MRVRVRVHVQRRRRARRLHLSLAVGFEQARVERARRVDGVLARERGVRGAHGALPEPWQRDLAAALVLFERRRRRRRGGGHRRRGTWRAGREGGRRSRDAPASERARGAIATAAARRAARPRRGPRSRTLAHYAASVSSYTSPIYSPKAAAAEPREGRA